MKKLLFLSLLALGALSAQATTVNFLNSCSGGIASNLPEGWVTTGDGTYSSSASGGIRCSQPTVGRSYLITPLITGQITFSYENDSGWSWGDDESGIGYDDGSIIVYKMQLNDSGEFTTVGTALFGDYYGSDDEIEKTLTLGDEPCYVGFVINDSYLYSATYTEAQPADKSIAVTAASFAEGSFLTADENGNVAFSVTFTVKNNGVEAISAGEEGYTIDLTGGSAGVLASFTPTEGLAVDEEKTMTFTGSFPISLIADEYTLGDRKTYWCEFGLKQNITNSTRRIEWRDVYPYQLAAIIAEPGTAIPVEKIDFGFLNEDTEAQTVELNNLGWRDITVTGITMPAGFSVSTTVPFTVSGAINSNHRQSITVTPSTSVSGILSGVMSIAVEGMDTPLTVNLAAVNPGGDFYYQNFETSPIEGWIIDEGLTIQTESAALLGTGNTKCLTNTGSGNTFRAITPLLSANAGEKVVFQAGAKNVNSDAAKVVVLYSPNRSDWTTLMTIRAASRASEGQEKFPATSVGESGYYYDTPMGTYEVTMPEGEGYLAFDLCYARIDNVFGAQPVAVDHDLLFSKSNIPSKGMVNNPYNATVTVRNVGVNDEAAGSYTVSLIVDGQTVASAEETPAIAAGAEQAFSFAYTPHAAGTANTFVEFRAGDYVLASVPVEAEILEEAASGEITVGSGEFRTTGSSNVTAPFHFWYKNSRSMVIYTQDYLSANGINPGTTITGISYLGKFNQKSGMNGPVTVWIAPTEKTSLAAADGYELEPTMTDDNRYFYNADYQGTVTESGVQDGKVFEMMFDTPYVYSGGNIIISCQSEFTAYDSGDGFIIDTALTDRSISKGVDNASAFPTTAYRQAVGVPVTTFYFAKTPQTYSGTVTNANDNAPVADATVTLTSGDVIYSGTSDASGAFSVSVIQADKEYTVTASAANYNTYTGEAPVSFADGDVVAEIQLTPTAGSGIAGVNADKGNVRISEREIVVEGIEGTVLSVFAANGTLCAKAEGNRVSIESLTPGVYVLNVANQGSTATVKFIKK